MRRRQAGFSLVELMVAMTITLIVSSAIYGLLSSGSNAFRREPELAERQQNIRVAMDLIARDVLNAGAALPPWSQAFTRTDLAGACTAGLNGCGIAGTMGPTSAAGRGTGDTEATDVLEIVTTDEQCPAQSLCSTAPVAGSEGLFVTRERTPACLRVPGFVALTNGAAFAIQVALVPPAVATACPGGTAAANGNLQLSAPLSPWVGAFTANTESETPLVFAYAARVVRYRIAPNPDPQVHLPALWRNETGRFAPDGSVTTEPGTPGFSPGGSPWEMVAQGIEDLQIEYRAAGPWENQPPIATANDWNSLVRQVRITLSARAVAPGLQGETTSPGGAPRAVRGQLSTVVTPRAAFHEMQMGNKIQ